MPASSSWFKGYVKQHIPRLTIVPFILRLPMGITICTWASLSRWAEARNVQQTIAVVTELIISTSTGEKKLAYCLD
jgi:hypothetical protein